MPGMVLRVRLGSCPRPGSGAGWPSPERADYRQVLLLADLEEALRRINSHLPQSAVEQAVEMVRKPESLDVVVSNRAFHRLLLEGIPVKYKRDDKVIHDQAFLVDFGDLNANRFRAINQFTIEGSKQLRRPDIVCFINGLPFAVLELKSPAAENVNIWDAFNQIQTYKDEVTDLFAYNEAAIISDGYLARVGSLTASQERYMPWRTIKNEDDKPLLEWQLETLVRGFFDRELFLDYIRYFVIFETDSDQLIKKIAGYHQFHAVREAVRATVIAAKDIHGRDRGEKRATPEVQWSPAVRKLGWFGTPRAPGRASPCAVTPENFCNSRK